jgi:AmiR/NasT family two-component response regulator
VGAINLYGGGPDAFSDEAEVTVGTFAGYAAVTIANAALYADAVDQANQLRIAMESRAVIEQAKGIVMAQNACGADQAFVMLARLSQTRNVKLRDLAQDLVQRARSRGGQQTL